MFSVQRRGERDAGAGDLCASSVRKSERRRDSDCHAAKPCDGSDDRRLNVRAAIYGDGLTVAEPHRSGNRNNGGTHCGGGAHRGAAGRANRRDDAGFEVRTLVNPDGLAGAETCHT